ncbi:MAG TPA: M20 family metallopeptidase, partial [Steroidobacteraceae bacterium]|nr:M20 family metallopeptidase [Steroidobacteraceae bacterium]
VPSCRLPPQGPADPAGALHDNCSSQSDRRSSRIDCRDRMRVASDPRTTWSVVPLARRTCLETEETPMTTPQPETGLGATRGAELARTALPLLAARLPDYLRDLTTLANLDSGTYDRAEVERVGAWVRARCRQWGAQIEDHPGGAFADSFAARLGGQGTRHVVLLAHLDTVFPAGTTAERPLRIEGERVLGPGTCDMKAGLLMGIYAVEALAALGCGDFGEVRLVCTTDEEVGAPSSRAFVERMAEGAAAVLVLEAGRENGDIVGQRRGGGVYRLEVAGGSAHAGVEPQKGRSAALSLARQVVALHGLTDLEAGRTVNVGIIHAGTRANVVPDHAEAEVDLRFNTAADMERLLCDSEAALASAALDGTTYTWTPLHMRPPWERNDHTDRLAAQANLIAQALGFSVRAAATGGTSDGNFTAARGVPTLDGLGPIGGLDHSPREYVEIPSVAPRTALLAGLIAAVTSG